MEGPKGPNDKQDQILPPVDVFTMQVFEINIMLDLPFYVKDIIFTTNW